MRLRKIRVESERRMKSERRQEEWEACVQRPPYVGTPPILKLVCDWVCPFWFLFVTTTTKREQNKTKQKRTKQWRQLPALSCMLSLVGCFTTRSSLLPQDFSFFFLWHVRTWKKFSCALKVRPKRHTTRQRREVSQHKGVDGRTTGGCCRRYSPTCFTKKGIDITVGGE